MCLALAGVSRILTKTDPHPPAIPNRGFKQQPLDVRRTHNTWYMPLARRLAIHYPHGLIHTIVTCATPMTDRTSMILQWVYRNDTEEQVSSADVVAFDRAVTLEDKRILESCDAHVPLADTDGEEMHMRTDYPGVVVRRMLAKLLADHGETEQRAGG